MPLHPAFDCLGCGTHRTASIEDLEGWARLCPACLRRAGEDPSIRSRWRAALDEWGRARAAGAPGRVGDLGPTAAPGPPRTDMQAGQQASIPGPSGAAIDREMVTYYEARAGEYDDWYLRRGRYGRGPIDDGAWAADLDRATRSLDALPWHGELVELAAGTGWWSPVLAARGELWCYDAAPAPLERARRRLLAHGLRAHLHVRDAWADPDRTVDGLFTGFWLSHVERTALPIFLDLVRRWLRPGGLYAFVDSLPDPASGVVDRLPSPAPDRSRRRLADGREFSIPKILYTPMGLETALRTAGFADVRVERTARFFVLGQARV